MSKSAFWENEQSKEFALRYFDYFFEKGYVISVAKDYDLAEECFSGAYDWSVDGSSTKDSDAGSYTDTWFEAANKAIESCIDLINKKTINNE